MGEKIENRWIPVTLESEEQEFLAETALAECKKLRLWVFERLQERLVSKRLRPTKSSELLPELAVYQQGRLHKLQRYTQLSVLNRAVAHFNNHIVTQETENGLHIYFPGLEEYPETDGVEIESRSVWPRYMEQYGRISTAYGSIFLESEWCAILAEQGQYYGIPANVVPLLIYSATLRKGGDGWQLYFNLHTPSSKEGKKRLKKRRRA